MLNLVVRPHRQYLLAGTGGPQKLFVMLRCLPRVREEARVPVALALVVDTSGSMRERVERGLSKLEHAIQAAHRLVEDPRLQPADQLALVQFADEASALLPLTPLAEREQIHRAIGQLERFHGSTRMARGLRAALDALQHCPPQYARRAFVLTDGMTFDEAECGEVIALFSEQNLPLTTLGVGTTYNHELLLELAERSRGRPAHLRSILDLDGIVETEVDLSLREVVSDTRLAVETVRGVELESLARVYPVIWEVDRYERPYRLGNLSAGDFTVFIVELSVGGIVRPPSRARLARFTVEYSVFGQTDRQIEGPRDLEVVFTTDETRAAVMNDEVLGYVQQKNVDRLLHRAARQSGHDPEGARQSLRSAIRVTQRLGNFGATQMLRRALEELNGTGDLSPDTVKTIRAGGRTMTVRTELTEAPDGLPSEEEIRRITGT
ncbi:MAG: VWA domain-containing protein [Armatimonadetes bacterium]|nr:VWA domain-containing protein [Armatimonadota bacterium]